MFHSRVHLKASGIRYLTSKSRNGTCNRIPCFSEIDHILKPSAFYLQTIARWKSTVKDQNSAVSEIKEAGNTELTISEKVKQTTKDASYLGIIIAGVSITGLMFYAIARELFSGQSPNSVYTDALKICRSDTKIVDTLGEPIKGYGELSSRGRRRHVSHFKYEKNGKNYMRMKFYVEGVRKKGTVHLEVKEDKNSKYDYRYLFVDIDGYPPRTIILKDNRHQDEVNELPLLNS